jgi:hypothetical protein
LVFVLACGSLGLIGLSRFLQCSVSFFCSHPFSGLCRVRFGRTSRRSHRKTLFIPKQERAFTHSISLLSIPFIHFRPCFPCKKNYTTRQKNAPALRVPRRQPQPSFRYATLRTIRVCHPRSTRSRLAPLHYAGKKSLRFAPLIFYPLRFGSRLFYLRCFCATPRQPPTTHPF